MKEEDGGESSEQDLPVGRNSITKLVLTRCTNSLDQAHGNPSSALNNVGTVSWILAQVRLLQAGQTPSQSGNRFENGFHFQCRGWLIS